MVRLDFVFFSYMRAWSKSVRNNSCLTVPSFWAYGLLAHNETRFPKGKLVRRVFVIHLVWGFLLGPGETAKGGKVCRWEKERKQLWSLTMDQIVAKGSESDIFFKQCHRFLLNLTLFSSSFLYPNHSGSISIEGY